MKINFKDLVLFENDDLYVINKPAGISCLAEHTAPTLALFDLAKAYDPNARLCHRLDKHTSGCLIISKNDDTYRHVAILFEKRKVSKLYHAIAHGASNYDHEIVDLPLVKKVNGTAILARGGKDALTEVSTLESFGHYSLLACEPRTGRFHQIRVHLKSLEHPIAADELYGGHIPHLSEVVRRYKPSAREENPMIKRYALHAFQLNFASPKGDEIQVTAPYPKDFETLLKLLRKNDKA